MNRLFRARDLIGLPVVAIATGDDVAEIRDVVYDSEQHRLLGFTLNKRGFLAGRLAHDLLADHASIGPDAVMVDSSATVTETDDSDAVAARGSSVDVIGVRVVTSDGNALGTVADVVVQAGDTACAVGYEVAPADSTSTLFVPISAQMAVSTDNLMLPPGATDFVRHDLAGFGAALDDYRANLEADRS